MLGCRRIALNRGLTVSIRKHQNEYDFDRKISEHMARPTIQDVAREAGVSSATVDRVLNARLPVRAETARRVAEAAHALGYHAAGLIERRLDKDIPLLRLGFLLLKAENSRLYCFLSDRRRVCSEAGRRRSWP